MDSRVRVLVLPSTLPSLAPLFGTGPLCRPVLVQGISPTLPQSLCGCPGWNKPGHSGGLTQSLCESLLPTVIYPKSPEYCPPHFPMHMGLWNEERDRLVSRLLTTSSVLSLVMVIGRDGGGGTGTDGDGTLGNKSAEPPSCPRCLSPHYRFSLTFPPTAKATRPQPSLGNQKIWKNRFWQAVPPHSLHFVDTGGGSPEDHSLFHLVLWCDTLVNIWGHDSGWREDLYGIRSGPR